MASIRWLFCIRQLCKPGSSRGGGDRCYLVELSGQGTEEHSGTSLKMNIPFLTFACGPLLCVLFLSCSEPVTSQTLEKGKLMRGKESGEKAFLDSDHLEGGKKFLTSCKTSLQNKGQTRFLSFLGLIDYCALRARDKRHRGSVSVVLLRCGSGYTWQPWGSYFSSFVCGFSFSCRSWEGPSENRACGFGVCWLCVVGVTLGTRRTTTRAKGLFHFTGDKK